jgi:hypothetical protein
MIIHCFDQPIPVITELGKGYILYVKSGSMFENDEFAIVLENGYIRHFLITQFKIEANPTYKINTNEKGRTTETN